MAEKTVYRADAAQTDGQSGAPDNRLAPDNRPAPRRAKRGVTALLAALCVLLALAAGAFGYFYMRSADTLRAQDAALAARQQELDRQQAELEAHRAEIERLKGELKAYTEGGEPVPVEVLRRYADEVVSLTELMSRFYPDFLVYADAESELVYQPIDTALPRNTYDWAALTEDEQTKRKSYADASGLTATLCIDVSEYQGSINWAKVKADGVSCAFLRAGLRGYESGTIFEDERLTRNLAGANKAGVPVGVYFYSQAATPAEAVEEAEFVLGKIAGYEVALPVVMDLEEENADSSRTKGLTAAERTDIAIAFCERIRQAGYEPMLYGNMRMFASKLELARLTGYRKWFAQYFSRPYFPYEFDIWQYSSSGSVAGISGNVDLNLVFRPLTENDAAGG